MLMLKISELLEDYTRQKVTLQLGDSLMSKFDKVWIYEDGQEQEIAMSDLKTRASCYCSNRKYGSY